MIGGEEIERDGVLQAEENSMGQPTAQFGYILCTIAQAMEHPGSLAWFGMEDLTSRRTKRW